jgi:hypothetical protein
MVVNAAAVERLKPREKAYAGGVGRRIEVARDDGRKLAPVMRIKVSQRQGLLFADTLGVKSP